VAETNPSDGKESPERAADERLSYVNHFETAQPALAGLDANATASLIAAAADVALILDGDGVIRDVSVGSVDMALEGYRQWVGLSWAETVTVESRPKVEALLSDAGGKAARKWRHVNHPSARGADVPVLYSAIRIGKEGPVVAFGRDLRPLSTLQQRLVEAQQAMERDYLRLRHMETRYRHLFQSVSEAVLIVDPVTLQVTDANPASSQVIGEPLKRIIGRAVPECFDEASRPAVLALMATVRSGARAEDVKARLSGGQWELSVSASLFRQESGSLVLMRLAPSRADAAMALPQGSAAMLLKAVESIPDAFVVTDPDGRVLTANSAFVELTQLASPDQVLGESLDRWLGRSGVDLSVLIANLRQHGSVRLFATTLRGQYGSTSQVEISATAVPHGEQPCLGFTIRDIGRRLAGEPRGRRELPRSAGQLTELVGRVPLKDIVGETTDLIEQLCIEAALELTRDNRASAAEMLGLSRQSLYVKLRRYGLGDLGGDPDK
jgi:transcriptional regulator PpsR